MGKMQKNKAQLAVVARVSPAAERKHILDSMVASFKIEGIFIPEARVQAIYARVNERLKK